MCTHTQNNKKTKNRWSVPLPLRLTIGSSKHHCADLVAGGSGAQRGDEVFIQAIVEGIPLLGTKECNQEDPVAVHRRFDSVQRPDDRRMLCPGTLFRHAMLVRC